MKLRLFLFAMLFFIGKKGYCQLPDARKSNVQSVLAHQRQHDDKSGFDVRFYHLSLDIATDIAFLKGDVLCEFMSTQANLTEIRLQLTTNYEIVRILGAVKAFERNGDEVLITLRTPLQIGQVAWIKVLYKGSPTTFNANNTISGVVYSPTNEPFYIASSAAPLLSHHWFPCKRTMSDKVDSVYMDLTIPDMIIQEIPVVAISNGKLADIDLLSGKRTFKWKHQYPILPHHIMFAIANYKTVEQNVDLGGQQMNIHHYVFPKHYAAYLKQIKELPEVIQFFSTRFGVYPFLKANLSITEIEFKENIEAQGYLAVTDIKNINQDKLIYQLAKNWFGYAISCGSPKDVWLNESLSAYALTLWKEHKAGKEAYLNEIKKNAYRGEGMLYGEQEEILYSDFMAHKLEKGVYVLHMLRGIVGEKVFFEILKTFALDDRFRYNFTTTQDFTKTCESVSQKKLGYFFNDWLYGEYFPVYEYKFWRKDNKKIGFQVIQQKYATEPIFFTLPIEIRVTLNGKDTTLVLFNDNPSQTWELDLEAKKLEDIVLDPNQWLFKDVLLKENRLSDKGLIRDLTIKGENANNRYLTISMRAFTKQLVVIELKTLSGKIVYATELNASDLVNETIKIPQYVPDGNYQLFLTSNSSIFSKILKIGGT